MRTDCSGDFCKKNFVHHVEAPDHKVTKDQITFLPCSNTSGTRKLTLYVIGKLKNPRAFKNVKNIFDKYSNQAWATQELIINWFNELFIPSIKVSLQ